MRRALHYFCVVYGVEGLYLLSIFYHFRYIYTDNTDIISFNDACALYYAAKKYMLLHLKTECLEYLINNLTAADCCLAYEFAQMFDEKDLLKACEEVSLWVQRYFTYSSVIFN